MNRVSWMVVLPWSPNTAGGVSTVARELLREFARTPGVEPVLVVNDWAALTPVASPPEDSVPRYRFRIPNLDPLEAGVRQVLGFAKQMITQSRSLLSLVARHKANVINVHFGISLLAPLLLLRMCGAYKGQIVMSLHGADVIAYRAAPRALRLLANWMLGACDHVVAVSSSFGETVTEVFPAAKRKLRIIPNGVRISAAVAPIRMPEDFLFICVATYEEKKGIDVTIRAFARAFDCDTHAKLLIVGRATPYLSRIRDLVNELGMSEQIELRTDLPHEELLSLYCQARAFVLNSRFEPFGLVILEAGLHGLPIIASRVGGIQEIVESEDLGLLVPVDDINATYRAMRRLFENPQLRDDLGRRLKEHAMTSFSWQRTRDRYLQLVGKQETA